MAMLHAADKSRKRFDVVIVGAGFAGLALAVRLADHVARLAVIEAGDFEEQPYAWEYLRCGPRMHWARLMAGHGESRSREACDAAREGRVLLQRHLQDYEAAFVACGRHLWVGADESEELREIEESLRFLQDNGSEARWITPPDLFGDLPAGRCAWFADDAACDARQLRHALLQVLRRYQVDCRPRTTLLGIEDDQGLPLHTSQGTLRAEMVVLANAARASQLLPFCRFKIVPMRLQSLTAQWEGQRRSFLCTRTHGYETWFVRPDANVQVSGHRRLPVRAEMGNRRGTTAEVQALLEENLRDLRGGSPGQIVVREAFVQALPCDGLPLAGAVPGQGRLFVSTGFGDYGVPWAFAAAARIAEIIVEGKSHQANPFSPRRFT